ncbi:MAG: ATP-binding protein [Acidimicrobiales bacterium]
MVSPDYVAETNPVFDDPLSEPPVGSFEMDFDVALPLQHLRHAVSVFAGDAGITAGRTADLILAVNELATNSVRHGGGRGILRIWSDTENVVCEVRDQGRIGEPLIGREHLARHQDGGRAGSGS